MTRVIILNLKPIFNIRFINENEDNYLNYTYKSKCYTLSHRPYLRAVV